MPLDHASSAGDARSDVLKTGRSAMKFPGQHANETIVLALRRHWTAYTFEMLILIGAFFLPIGGFFVFQSVLPDLLDPPNVNVLWLLLSLYALFVALYFFLVWIDRYFDVWIVTNERLIDVEQKSFFNRVTSELELDKIQDVKVEVKGVLPTLFKYGSVFVQTAGTNRNFHVQDIKNPTAVKDVIIELERAYTSKNGTAKPPAAKKA